MAKRIESPPRPRKRKKQDIRGTEKPEQLKCRSASELGIVYPGSYCDDAKTTPHYWREVDKVEGGSLFQCKNCYRHLWLPMFHIECGRLGNLMGRSGLTGGYCSYLDKHRAAKILMAKLQDLRRLEMEIDDKREFARLTDKIMNDKDYDRKDVKG